MRIISGSAKGRSLKTTSAPGLRPAMARTREALFSMLEARGLDWSVSKALDLYAGCGSLALECVSRGAQQAWLVDNSKEACACIAANIAALGMDAQCSLFEREVLRFLRCQPAQAFDLVFIDPPYGRNLTEQSLLLLQKGWLKPGAFIVCEVEKNLTLYLPPNFIPTAKRNFGQTSLYIWSLQ